MRMELWNGMKETGQIIFDVKCFSGIMNENTGSYASHSDLPPQCFVSYSPAAQINSPGKWCQGTKWKRYAHNGPNLPIVLGRS